MSTIPQKSFYQDGDYSTPQKIYESAKTYPLLQDGDALTYMYTKRYLVNAKSYVPTVQGSPDFDDPNAVLVSESDLIKDSTPLARFERTYCTIPNKLIDFSSVQYALPSDLPGAPFTATGIFNSYNTLGSTYYDVKMLPSSVDIYSRGSGLTDSGAATVPTSGTYTLSFPGKRYNLNLVTNAGPNVGAEMVNWTLGANTTGKTVVLAASVIPNKALGFGGLTLSISLAQGAVTASTVFAAYHDRAGVKTPATAGLRYQASCYLSADKCGGYASVSFYNVGGTLISSFNGNEINQVVSSGRLKSWQRSSLFATAPAGTASAITSIYGVGKGIAAPSLHFCGIYMGEAEASQVNPSDWLPYETDKWSSSALAYDASSATILAELITMSNYGAIKVSSVTGGATSGSIDHAAEVASFPFTNFDTSNASCVSPSPVTWLFLGGNALGYSLGKKRATDDCFYDDYLIGATPNFSTPNFISDHYSMSISGGWSYTNLEYGPSSSNPYYGITYSDNWAISTRIASDGVAELLLSIKSPTRNNYPGIWAESSSINYPGELTINGNVFRFNGSTKLNELINGLNAILPAGMMVGGAESDNAAYSIGRQGVYFRIWPVHTGFCTFDFIGRKIVAEPGSAYFNDAIPELAVDVGSLTESTFCFGMRARLKNQDSYSNSNFALSADVSGLGAGTWATRNNYVNASEGTSASMSISIIPSSSSTFFQRKVTFASPHKFKDSDKLMYTFGTTNHFRLVSGNFRVVSDKEIEVKVPSSVTTTIQSFGKLLLKYDRRTARIKTRVETEYLLKAPDSTGIVSDLAETGSLDQYGFLTAVIRGDDEVLLEESDLTKWKGPIYAKSKTYLLLANP